MAAEGRVDHDGDGDQMAAEGRDHGGGLAQRADHGDGGGVAQRAEAVQSGEAGPVGPKDGVKPSGDSRSSFS
jgi:hypothetical protein